MANCKSAKLLRSRKHGQAKTACTYISGKTAWTELFIALNTRESVAALVSSAHAKHGTKHAQEDCRPSAAKPCAPKPSGLLLCGYAVDCFPLASAMHAAVRVVKLH